MSEDWQELARIKIDHWEPFIDNEKRTGKVWIYYRDGRMFAKPPVWDGEEDADTDNRYLSTE